MWNPESLKAEEHDEDELHSEVREIHPQDLENGDEPEDEDPDGDDD